MLDASEIQASASLTENKAAPTEALAFDLRAVYEALIDGYMLVNAPNTPPEGDSLDNRDEAA